MALVSRSARRGGVGRRWLLIGVVITLFVLLIDASLHSRSPVTDNELATGAWVDRAVPLVTSSIEQGQQLAGVWATGFHTSAATLSAELDQIATGTASTYQQAAALRPPVALAGAAGLLDAALLARSEGAAAIRAALAPILQGTATSKGGTASASTVTAVQTAGEDLQVGDQAYRLFLHSLPNVGVPMPSSAWVANSSPYQLGPAQLFLTTLQNAMSATPVHQVKIDSMTTSPATVSSHGNVQILPDAPAMAVTVVLSDLGNQPEKGLTVTASIAPAGGSSSVRDFVDLAPGQAQTIQGMGPLNPPEGVPVTLTLTVTPPAGSSTPVVSQTLVFMMPGSASPVQTTTLPPTSSSTSLTG
jgi:hypothetical protein